MINLFAIIAVGFVLGIRHATDPDHVIAVSTIVTRENNVKHAAAIGVAWGLGHTLTILAVGSAMIVFRIALPPRVGLGMEMAVALMLVLLGLRNIGIWFFAKPQEAMVAAQHPHEHPHYHSHGDYIHVHSHSHANRHEHDPKQTPLGALDRWLGRASLYQMLRPLAVGIVHGLAGSAAIALLVLSTIQTFRWAVLYLAVFGFGTVLGMVLITIGMASTFSYGQRRFVNIGRHFTVASGIISLVFGLAVAYQIGFINGFFSGNVQWIPC